MQIPVGIYSVNPLLILAPYNLLMSGGRDLNPQPSPWEGDILPLNYHRTVKVTKS